MGPVESKEEVRTLAERAILPKVEIDDLRLRDAVEYLLDRFVAVNPDYWEFIERQTPEGQKAVLPSFHFDPESKNSDGVEDVRVILNRSNISVADALGKVMQATGYPVSAEVVANGDLVIHHVGVSELMGLERELEEDAAEIESLQADFEKRKGELLAEIDSVKAKRSVVEKEVAEILDKFRETAEMERQKIQELRDMVPLVCFPSEVDTLSGLRESIEKLASENEALKAELEKVKGE